MNETTHNVVPEPLETLHAELRSLIASSHQRLAGAVNAELTQLYWAIGVWAAEGASAAKWPQRSIFRRFLDPYPDMGTAKSSKTILAGVTFRFRRLLPPRLLGQRLRAEVLGEGRASYGAQLLDQLGQQVTQEFGRGFESRNMCRMVKFAEGFPDAAIVSTLSAKLG